jgi:hypothetical protein
MPMIDFLVFLVNLNIIRPIISLDAVGVFIGRRLNPCRLIDTADKKYFKIFLFFQKNNPHLPIEKRL